jgi:hypothetical protein
MTITHYHGAALNFIPLRHFVKQFTFICTPRQAKKEIHGENEKNISIHIKRLIKRYARRERETK